MGESYYEVFLSQFICFLCMRLKRTNGICQKALEFMNLFIDDQDCQNEKQYLFLWFSSNSVRVTGVPWCGLTNYTKILFGLLSPLPHSFFHIFTFLTLQYSVQIRENTYQKKLSVFGHFSHSASDSESHSSLSSKYLNKAILEMLLFKFLQNFLFIFCNVRLPYSTYSM